MDKFGKVENMIIKPFVTQNDLEGTRSSGCLVQSTQNAEKNVTVVDRPVVCTGAPPHPPKVHGR